MRGTRTAAVLGVVGLVLLSALAETADVRIDRAVEAECAFGPSA